MIIAYSTNINVVIALPILRSKVLRAEENELSPDCQCCPYGERIIIVHSRIVHTIQYGILTIQYTPYDTASGIS
jgi:hypothetical protein